jgi:hypothetical protein
VYYPVTHTEESIPLAFLIVALIALSAKNLINL